MSYSILNALTLQLYFRTDFWRDLASFPPHWIPILIFKFLSTIHAILLHNLATYIFVYHIWKHLFCFSSACPSFLLRKRKVLTSFKGRFSALFLTILFFLLVFCLTHSSTLSCFLFLYSFIFWLQFFAPSFRTFSLTSYCCSFCTLSPLLLEFIA